MTRNIKLIITIFFSLIICIFLYCKGSGDVELSDATKLVAEDVEFPNSNPDNPDDDIVNAVFEEPGDPHDLFSGKPGEFISFKRLRAVHEINSIFKKETKKSINFNAYI